jgi:phosphohistidine phosphatase SixA
MGPGEIGSEIGHNPSLKTWMLKLSQTRQQLELEFDVAAMVKDIKERRRQT